VNDNPNTTIEMYVTFSQSAFRARKAGHSAFVRYRTVWERLTGILYALCSEHHHRPASSRSRSSRTCAAGWSISMW
jgi:hypothetical protein